MVHLARRTGLLLVTLAVGACVSAPPTAVRSDAPAPSSPPAATATASATPRDVVLPSGCALVGRPTTATPGPITSWEVSCGASPDAMAVERFMPVLAQQGWTLCKAGQGRGFWWKGTTQTIVSQSAVGYPLLSQMPRQADDCP